MPSSTTIVFFVPGIVLGVIAGFLINRYFLQKKFEKEREEREEDLRKSQKKIHQVLSEAQNEALQIRKEAQKEQQQKHAEFRKVEERLIKKEEDMERKIENLDKAKDELDNKISKVREVKLEVEKIHSKQAEELEKVSKMSKEEARDLLFKKVEEESKDDILRFIEKMERDMKKDLDDRARLLLAEAIQKYSSEVVSETTVTTVELQDDMKGRIIGREGRNINAFERITGVDVIVDDTPGMIVISCFDPIRRYVAKIALEQLVADGRIHPAKIEEIVDKVKKDTLILIKDLGEKAAFDAGVTGLPPNLLKILGRLKFRTSYGQNALKSSMEVAMLAESIAGSLGANADLAKKAGLLQSIGMAVDHEVRGNHAEISADILKKFNMAPDLIEVVRAQADDVKPNSVEAYIVMAAREISSHRPGAKKDTLDSFIKRLTEFELIAKSFAGVENAYALQSGRRVRVFVDPEDIDDLQSKKMTLEIAKKISEASGQSVVEVHVIREKRAEAYAM